jgi:hypothetical protein
MIMDGQVLKTALGMAGALGHYQGLIEFVRRNPDYYSHEQLLAELFKLDSEERAKLDALETELRDEDEQ